MAELKCAAGPDDEGNVYLRSGCWFKAGTPASRTLCLATQEPLGIRSGRGKPANCPYQENSFFVGVICPEAGGER